ncbi:hypothetical protein [Nonomuraea sp. NPDC003754]
MTSYRFPAIAGSVRWEGSVVRLAFTQVWPSDDPFVVARPDLFSPDPHEVTRTTPADVEADAPRPARRRRAKG